MDDKIEIVIEDSEEFPTNVKKKIKVLEMPVFTDDDKKNIEKMLGRMDRFISDSYAEKAVLRTLMEEERSRMEGARAHEETVSASVKSIDNFVSDIYSERAALRQVLEDITNKVSKSSYLHELVEKLVTKIDSLLLDFYSESAFVEKLAEDTKTGLDDSKAVQERIVLFLDRAVNSVESLNQSLNELRMGVRDTLNERISITESKLEEKLYALDSTISYLKGLVIDLSDKINASQGSAEAKMALLVENMSEKFDAYMTNLNSRLDSMVLQFVEPLNDISLRIDKLKNLDDIVENIRPELYTGWTT